jgi:hypothetical protein
MNDVQTCPRRLHECGPWEHLPERDEWVADRWLTDRVAAAARQAAQDRHWLDGENRGRAERNQPPRTQEDFDKHVHRGPHNDLWLFAAFGPPRTCSFCGGCHPEDVLRLLEAGWELESTDKNYKRYLQPPGYHAHMDGYFQSLQDAFRKPGEIERPPAFWHPTPPVKVYLVHFSQDQIDQANRLIDERRAAAGAAARTAPGEGQQ